MGSHNRVKGEIHTKERKSLPLFREKRKEVSKFIEDQMRKRYIWPSKLPQTVLVFFIRKKNGKKRIV